jgi:hypothetical protein
MSEELQRYLVGDKKKDFFKGDNLGKYQWFVLGSTTLSQLKAAGIIAGFSTDTKFRAKIWKGKPSATNKPDEIILDGTQCVLVVERKDSVEISTQRQEEAAAEQCLTYVLTCPRFLYQS